MSYLKKQGFEVQLHEDKSRFEEFANDCKYCIYINAGFTGGHYTLLTNNKDASKTFNSINPLGTTTISTVVEKYKNYLINLLITIK